MLVVEYKRLKTGYALVTAVALFHQFRSGAGIKEKAPQ